MRYSVIFFVFFIIFGNWAQHSTNLNRFSLGVLSTFSAFSDDGTGLGTGGQFRLRFTPRVNSDWFADYIVVNHQSIAKSEYVHIGWSVLFYPMNQQIGRFQPYVLAGHCFDYNKLSINSQPEIYGDRWGSAVQAGLGTHFLLSPQVDLSLTSQYMVHLTKELTTAYSSTGYTIVEKSGNSFEGHLLTTISINYRFIKK
ncbi:MAG: hypothetical protein RLZZ30_1861 [Bacteroidota bacterium]|jgi:hypothetical protein